MAKQVAELDPLVAADARHRGFAAAIGFGEILDHRGAKAAFVIEHVMGDAEPAGDRGRVIDVAAGAARSLTPERRAVIVELQGDADHLKAALGQQRRRHRGIDPARHGDDDAVIGRAARKIEIKIEIEGIGAHARDYRGLLASRNRRGRLAMRVSRPGRARSPPPAGGCDTACGQKLLPAAAGAASARGGRHSRK